MNTFSRSSIRRKQKRDKRNIFRALFVLLMMTGINLIFNILIDPSKTILPFVLGIVFPIFYSFFYFYSKRIKYKFKIQTNSVFLTPFYYLLIGFTWYVIVLGYTGLTSIKIESEPNSKSKNFKASINTIEDFSKGQRTVKQSVMAALLYEDYLCRIANVPDIIIKSKCKNRQSTSMIGNCDEFHNSTTNKTISFVILFFSQMIIIFISENILYPLLKNKINPPKPSKKTITFNP
jgi:hypothetical protein